MFMIAALGGGTASATATRYDVDPVQFSIDGSQTVAPSDSALAVTSGEKPTGQQIAAYDHEIREPRQLDSYDLKPMTAEVDANGVTLENCRANYPIDNQNFSHYDRFSSCVVFNFGTTIHWSGGDTGIYVTLTAIWTTTNGNRSIHSELMSEFAYTTGPDLPDDFWNTEGTSLAFYCIPASSAPCGQPAAIYHTWGEWTDGLRFSQDYAATGTPGTSDPDNKALYQTGLIADAGTADQVYSPADVVRCDTATYIASAPEGCVFTSRTAVANFQYSRTPDIYVHIETAQDYPGQTKPGNFSLIPGKVEGTPLSRLYPLINDNSARYNRNHAIAVNTCKQYWGDDYTEGNTKDCDEYPFRSTYEGAAYSEINGGSVGYSAMPIDLTQNRRAGADLGVFYNNQRILDNDPFFVGLLP